MNILVVNCGSSSLKYQLINMENESVLAKGLVERIGIEGSKLEHQSIGKEKQVMQQSIKDHKVALEMVLEELLAPETGAIKSLDEIGAIGHRYVNAGEKYCEPTTIDEETLEDLKQRIDFAPLHNPAHIMGIEACQSLMPNVTNVAVFDTAFHSTMPPASYLYAIPYELYEKYGVRRYGAHGTSHKYVAYRTAEILGKNVEELDIVTCHLGNGGSIAAVKGGKVLDTSMGFTPLEGLIMGTRSGDIDPSAVTYIMERENLSVVEVNNLLNKKSGVLGISGISSDFRDIEKAVAEGNERAKLALDAFVYRVKRYIGAYIAQMGNVDAVVFTAGIGENGIDIRKMICENMEYIGIELDEAKNNVRGKETFINKEGGRVKVLIVPTNEELMIAKETLELI